MSRRLNRVLFTVTALSGLFAAGAVSAQEAPRGGERRQFSAPLVYPLGLGSHVYAQGPLVGHGQPHPSFQPGYYYGTPWYIPQTQIRKSSLPLPQYAEPRLGLHYLYPYAQQMGIQVPHETDPPIDPGAFGEFPSPAISEGVALMKAGKYADAGRRFSRELRGEEASPDLYLLIATALFAVGKLDDADIVLRKAIEAAPDLEFLARADLAGMFPGREALAEKLRALDAPGAPPLLKGTLRVLAGEGEKGLADLRAIQDRDPAAKRVYLRFLGAAFGEEPKPAPKPDEKKV